ncbi:LamB/YcsF family protein [Streptomyces sp. NPDC091272]|uniref:LamB/YcsF family protein n=1 Tax=Streptomyces sp. NPDC091272 TaxID=3365981 RepID=UPI0038277795
MTTADGRRPEESEGSEVPGATESVPAGAPPKVIDLNADLGEGFGRWTLTDDEALLSVVTSANVACGFHAGDPVTMRRVCELAAERGVRIGAQVSYRDLAGFGRRAMDVPPDELAAEVAYQIGALEVFARAAGSRVAYVKPHGALYNRTVHDAEQATAVVAGVRLAGGGLPVLGLPGSELLAAAELAELPSVPEAFADRAYTARGTLVSRREPGAVIHDADAVVTRAVTMATEGETTALTGERIQVRARSLCLHGDTPGASELAARVRAELVGAGVELEPFV